MLAAARRLLCEYLVMALLVAAFFALALSGMSIIDAYLALTVPWALFWFVDSSRKSWMLDREDRLKGALAALGVSLVFSLIWPLSLAAHFWARRRLGV